VSLHQVSPWPKFWPIQSLTAFRPCLLLVLFPSLVSAYEHSPKVPPARSLVVLQDGTILRAVSLSGSLDLVTRYGKLTIPVKDIRKIQVGLRLSKEEAGEIQRLVKQFVGENPKERKAAFWALQPARPS